MVIWPTILGFQVFSDMRSTSLSNRSVPTRIPMIDEPVPAACKTEDELANYIAHVYLVYKRNPSVSVFVKEFQSRPVAVIGAVVQPGQFRLQRQVRLLELVSFAGGPSDKSGRV